MIDSKGRRVVESKKGNAKRSNHSNTAVKGVERHVGPFRSNQIGMTNKPGNDSTLIVFCINIKWVKVWTKIESSCTSQIRTRAIRVPFWVASFSFVFPVLVPPRSRARSSPNASTCKSKPVVHGATHEWLLWLIKVKSRRKQQAIGSNWWYVSKKADDDDDS